tara:strand:- start:120 stop:425 length:306 start_codon:yes stop_codon:yes gene_type:complete
MSLKDLLPANELCTDFDGLSIIGLKADFRSPAAFAAQAIVDGFADDFLEVLKVTRTAYIERCRCNDFEIEMGEMNGHHWHIRPKPTPRTHRAWLATKMEEG